MHEVLARRGAVDHNDVHGAWKVLEDGAYRGDADTGSEERDAVSGLTVTSEGAVRTLDHHAGARAEGVDSPALVAARLRTVNRKYGGRGSAESE